MARAELLHFTGSSVNTCTACHISWAWAQEYLCFFSNSFLTLLPCTCSKLVSPSSASQRQFCEPKEMHWGNAGSKEAQPAESILQSRAGSSSWLWGLPSALLWALPTQCQWKTASIYFPAVCHPALGQQGPSRKCLKTLHVCAKWLWIAHARGTATQKDSWASTRLKNQKEEEIRVFHLLHTWTATESTCRSFCKENKLQVGDLSK